MFSISLPRIRGRSRRVLLAAALPAALAATALPAAAEANLVVLDQAVLTYQNQSVIGTHLTTRMINGQVSVQSSDGIRGHSTSCLRVSAVEVRCPAASVQFVRALMGTKADTVEYRVPHPGFVQLNDGDDTVRAGTRQAIGRAIQPVAYAGQAGRDTITYEGATAGVRLSPEDSLANDGRAGIDLENVQPDFESFIGSNFGDPQLFGTARADTMNGLDGNDALGGGGGDDLFVTTPGDGADEYHGGPHGVARDTISYETRTLGLTIDLDNLAGDGETGEGDNVRSNVENVIGGSGNDTFFAALDASSKLEGRGGIDRLFGSTGPDTLIGGAGPDDLIGSAGSDVLSGGSGTDNLQAQDNERDDVDCGSETDRFSVDSLDTPVVNCP